MLFREANKKPADGTPPDGPKSRKMHYGELVGRRHVSPHVPIKKARFQRAALEPFGVSFFHIFLHDKKDMAHGVRWMSRAVCKTHYLK